VVSTNKRRQQYAYYSASGKVEDTEDNFTTSKQMRRSARNSVTTPKRMRRSTRNNVPALLSPPPKEDFPTASCWSTLANLGKDTVSAIHPLRNEHIRNAQSAIRPLRNTRIRNAQIIDSPERTRKRKPAQNASTIPFEIFPFEFWSTNYAKNIFNISKDGCIKDEEKKRTLLLQQAPFAQKFLRRVLPEGYDLEKADRESVIKIQNKCHFLGRAYSIALDQLGHDEKDKIDSWGMP